MKSYLLAFAAPWLVIFALGLANAWAFMSHSSGNWMVYAATVVGVPVGTAWVIAEAASGLRRGRVFRRGPVGHVLIGGLAGVAAMALVMLIWATAGWAWNEAVVMGAAAAAVNIAVLFRPRRRSSADRCEECGYSLAGLPAPRCPECGRAVMSAAVAG